MAKFGEQMMCVNFAVKGQIHEALCAEITGELLKEIGMTPAHYPVSFPYPIENGAGGLGFTYFQPMVESFMCWDVYGDIGTAYLYIASCKPFMPFAAERVLRRYNLTIKDANLNGLGI